VSTPAGRLGQDVQVIGKELTKIGQTPHRRPFSAESRVKTRRLIIRPEAEAEMADAFDWYEDRRWQERI
jgi:hypothetical protein